MSKLTRSELEWIERYANHLGRERRLSDHTTSNYRRDLLQFADHLATMGVKRWPKVDTFHVQTFAAQLHRKGMAPRTVQRRLSALRGFFEYLIREDIVKTNPARDVRAPKAPKRLPLTLDADQMQRLLEIPGDDPLVIRDRAMMELMYSSGLRLAELVGLEPGDIDANDGTVRVTGKGDKTRVVPVGRLALAAVKSWLGIRAQLANAEEPALFVGRRGGRISRRQVQHRVRHWANRQGIPIRVFPHLFRHSFATHVLESSGDLRAVQELLGHANISTTQIYTHLDFQHLARVYDEAHPRARKRSRDD